MKNDLIQNHILSDRGGAKMLPREIWKETWETYKTEGEGTQKYESTVCFF